MSDRILLPRAQRGLSLVLVLVMLAAVLLLALAAAYGALQGEKAARNDRDRQQALRAAESALLDAETDVLLHTAGPRHDALTERTPERVLPGSCGTGRDNPQLGVCRAVAGDAVPVWRHATIADPAVDGSTVPYGHFTLATFPHGAGPLPRQPPHYIIEILDSNGRMSQGRVFRITSVGFGAHPGTKVVLQSWFRIIAGKAGGSRLAWREITDWSGDGQNEY